MQYDLHGHSGGCEASRMDVVGAGPPWVVEDCFQEAGCGLYCEGQPAVGAPRGHLGSESRGERVFAEPML